MGAGRKVDRTTTFQVGTSAAAIEVGADARPLPPDRSVGSTAQAEKGTSVLPGE
jgi:hypothetical protein